MSNQKNDPEQSQNTKDNQPDTLPPELLKEAKELSEKIGKLEEELKTIITNVKNE